MHPEEYRQIIKRLETHFDEFKVNCQGSQMFVDEDKRVVEKQINGAQNHYDKLVVQLPVYSQYRTIYTVSKMTNKSTVNGKVWVYLSNNLFFK